MFHTWAPLGRQLGGYIGGQLGDSWSTHLTATRWMLWDYLEASFGLLCDHCHTTWSPLETLWDSLKTSEYWRSVPLLCCCCCCCCCCCRCCRCCRCWGKAFVVLFCVCCKLLRYIVCCWTMQRRGCVEGCCHASGGNHEHTLYLQVLMTKTQNHMSNLLLLKNHLIYTILSTKCSIPI